MQEIRLQGRSGQGTVLASQILAAAAVSEGRYGNAIPCLGVGQEEALQTAFVRIADRPITDSKQIDNPHCVIVLDPSVNYGVDIYQGLRSKGTVILNETKMAHELCFPSQVTRIGLVDATGIAMEVLGIPVTNSVMLGAFAKTTGLVSLRSILDNLAGYVPTYMLAANRKAVKQGYESTTVVEIGVRIKEGIRCS